MKRYLHILWRFWKNSLIREMTFRVHFVVNIVTELIWVTLMIVFIKVIYLNTSHVSGWTEAQYLCLTGTHLIIVSIFETLFFRNCFRVGEMVRTGDLDFVLVRPAAAQFLLSMERVDFTPLASLPVGIALCLYALHDQGADLTVGRLAVFLSLVAGGVLILYSLLFMFAVTSVWLIRQTSVEHMWFYMVSFARYPADIYRRFLGGALWFVLVFVIPVLLVSNLPARVLVRTFDPVMVAYVFGSGLVLLVLSTQVFRLALRWYRSASS